MALEMMCGLPFSEDIWSQGCVTVIMVFGFMLFPTRIWDGHLTIKGLLSACFPTLFFIYYCIYEKPLNKQHWFGPFRKIMIVGLKKKKATSEGSYSFLTHETEALNLCQIVLAVGHLAEYFWKSLKGFMTQSKYIITKQLRLMRGYSLRAQHSKQQVLRHAVSCRLPHTGFRET